MSKQVCTQEDDFLRERWLSEVRWVVNLSNGEQVIQDDGRPGCEPASAWLRLGEYVREHRLRIEAMWIQFRHEPPIRMPIGAAGYFFRKSQGALLNTDINFFFYLVGYLQDEQVVVKRFQVPELIELETELRNPLDTELVGPSLIRNP